MTASRGNPLKCVLRGLFVIKASLPAWAFGLLPVMPIQ